MTSGTPNRIAQIRREKGLTQAQLGEKLGAHWITVSKLERGKMQLTYSWIERLADALDVEFERLLTNKSDRRSLDFQGFIGPGGSVESAPMSHPVIEIESSDADDLTSIWMQIRGDHSYPHYRNGDLLRFVTVDEKRSDLCVGRLCLIVSRTGNSEGHIGYLTDGTPGNCTIHPINAPPVHRLDPFELSILAEVHHRMPWHKD